MFVVKWETETFTAARDGAEKSNDACRHTWAPAVNAGILCGTPWRISLSLFPLAAARRPWRVADGTVRHSGSDLLFRIGVNTATTRRSGLHACGQNSPVPWTRTELTLRLGECRRLTRHLARQSEKKIVKSGVHPAADVSISRARCTPCHEGYACVTGRGQP
jgi:hypothetical protein